MKETDQIEQNEQEQPDSTREPKWRYRLQLVSERHNRVVFTFSMPVWLTAVFTALLSMAIGLFFLFFVTKTPLRNYLPGYLDVNKRSVVVESAMRIDSLAHESNLRSAYLDNMLAILLDTKISADSIVRYDSAIVRFSDSIMLATDRELEFVSKYEDQERFGLNSVQGNNQLSAVSFINVAKGKVLLPEEAEQVDPINGTRLQLSHETPVLAPLEGVVVLERYFIGNGYEITLQCSNEYVVVLSHLSSSMVYEGKTVKAGTAIGQAGAQKEADDRWMSVRIWYKGKPVDPQSVMNF